jgi:thymidine phosphorylase
VGLSDVRGPGDVVGPDQPLAIVHARSTADADVAAAALRAAVSVGEGPAPTLGSPVVGRIGGRA